jgi:DNA-directed RNA polymerase subunit N (RpoN/RPB10)
VCFVCGRNSRLEFAMYMEDVEEEAKKQARRKV